MKTFAEVPKEMKNGVLHAGKKLKAGESFEISGSDRSVEAYKRAGFIVKKKADKSPPVDGGAA